MARFWASWYSGNYEDEGCTAPPFKFWVTGTRFRENDGLTKVLYEQYQKIQDEAEAEEFLEKHAKDDCTICAVIDAESEEELFELVEKHFPDYQHRFCEQKADDWTQESDRFK